MALQTIMKHYLHVPPPPKGYFPGKSTPKKTAQCTMLPKVHQKPVYLKKINLQNLLSTHCQLYMDINILYQPSHFC